MDAKMSAVQGSVSDLVKAELDKFTESEEFGALTSRQRQQVANDIIKTINVQKLVGDEMKKHKNAIIGTAANKAEARLENKLRNMIVQQIENNIGDQVEMIASQLLSKKLLPYQKFNQSQVETNNSQESRIKDHEQRIAQLEAQVKVLLQNGVIGKASADKEAAQSSKRLKGFNIVSEIDQGVFAIRAPDRESGAKHYITLNKGESFISVNGRHKVKDINGSGTDASLLISGNYFIDKDRDEYTKAERQQIIANRKAKKAAQYKATQPPAKQKPKATQMARTTENHIGKPVVEVVKLDPVQPIVETQTIRPAVAQPRTQAIKLVNGSSSQSAPQVQYRDGKILLPDWAMITKAPDLSSALVVNLTKASGERTINIEKGKYYDFIGTVNEIKPNGTVCSDTYCIGALQ